jgi:hypothetical protein
MAIPLALMSNMGAAAASAATGANAAQGAGGMLGNLNPLKNQIGTAISLGQLLIGENSLFSGKKRLASRELKKNFEAGQNMGIGSKYYDYLSSMRSQAQQGIGEATKSLYNQQIGRSQASALRALSGRRSALGGIGSIVAAGAEGGLNLAAMDEQIRRQGQMAANQALFNIAGLEQQNELRKREEAASYWGAQRQESDQSISSALSGLGRSLGAQKTAAALSPKTV